jgi:hypothetical protein
MSNREDVGDKQKRWSYIKPTLIYVAFVLNYVFFLLFTTWIDSIRFDVQFNKSLQAMHDYMVTNVVIVSIVLGLFYCVYMSIALVNNLHRK